MFTQDEWMLTKDYVDCDDYDDYDDYTHIELTFFIDSFIY